MIVDVPVVNDISGSVVVIVEVCVVVDVAVGVVVAGG